MPEIHLLMGKRLRDFGDAVQLTEWNDFGKTDVQAGIAQASLPARQIRLHEWKAVPGQRLKQPFYVSMKDGRLISFAGLWKCVRTAEEDLLQTSVIVDMPTNETLAPIPHRVPTLIDVADLG